MGKTGLGFRAAWETGSRLQGKAWYRARHEAACQPVHSIRRLQVLSGHIFCHVPCPHFNYRQKAVYIAICLRRMMAAIIDPATCLDDRYPPPPGPHDFQLLCRRLGNGRTCR